MTVYYSDSPYGMTLGVSATKQAITSDLLQQCATFTAGGTIPFWIRYQYKVSFIITGGTVANPTYGGWGPLDETVDKINAIPGLRILLPIQQFPQFMLRIDGTGKDVGYGDPTAVLPRWDDYATVAEVIATRYGNRMHMYQIGNEEYDIQAHNGAVLAPVFNAAYPAIKRHSSSPVIMGAVRKLPPGGSHVSTWMNNFVNYKPNIGAGESPQAIPDGCDFHYYRDGSIITNTTNPAPDPATTDNSANPGVAAVPSVPGEYAIIQPILDTLSPGIPVMNCEFGWDNSNNASINSTYPGTTPPWYVSRYTLTQFALSHFAGISKSMQFTFGQYTDAKSLHRQGLLDMAAYIAANPQYTPGAAPTDKLYQTIDRLDYEGTVGAAPNDQYFAITNPTGSNKAWSVTSSQSWLTVATLPTNGIKGTAGAGLTSGTLTPSQQITLKAMVDSTQAGLTTLTTLTATLTVTVGANVSTITVNLWVNPNDAVPHITVDQTSSLQPTATVNGANPAGQVVTITNAGNYKHLWYGYTQAKWLSLSLESGTLNAGASQAITISADITGLAPGNYLESAYFCLTPFPPQYKNNAVPTNPQYVNVLVNLKVTASTAAAVQLSTSAMYFTAGASGALPATQQFFINNVTKSAQNWTVAAGSYTGGGSGWLTLTPASGNNLPASGSQTGTSPNVQSTDYTLVTASINSTALAAGTHTATVTCTLGGTATATILVTFEVTSSSPTEIIGASPGTVSASQIQGGSAVTTTTTLTNTGNTTGTWTKTKTYISGTGWLTMNPGTGSLAASGGTQVVTFTCTPGTLTPGSYSATVTFTLGTTTATVTVNFTVTSSGNPASIAAAPTSLVFSDVVKTGAAAPQTITLSNPGGQSGGWTAITTYTNGNSWIALSATSGTLAAGASQQVTVSMNDLSLAVGTYIANIKLTTGATTVQVSVTLIISAITTASSAQMTQSDMAAQYAYILSTIVGAQLSILANIYYGGSTTTQVVYGELDALFPFETMSQLHVMKSINDVTAFLNAYAYVAQVLSDSPIVYYRLGESSGIYAYDISGRKMTGTISTNNGVIAGVTQGQVGALTNSPDTAYLFDGTSGNILLPAGVNTANWAALSVECWIKLSNITFSQTAFIVANDAPLSTNLGFSMAVTKSSVVFRIGKGSSYYEINQSYTFAAGTWYHLVGVFAGTSLTAYINGNPIATVSVASALVAQTTNVVNIASKPGVTTNNFPGTLDEISLYNTALSAARVQVHYLGRLSGTSQTSYATLIVADGPVAFYRMNESSGLVAHDSTSNHYDATLSGSSLSYSVTGVLTTDTAIGFGGNDSLIFPSTLVLTNYAGYSLEYWISITQGWQHVVITVDASGNTLYYLNGASYSSGSGDSVVVDIDVYFTGSFSAGSLDEIAVYPYVLSAAQVANHFAVGSLGI